MPVSLSEIKLCYETLSGSSNLACLLLKIKFANLKKRICFHDLKFLLILNRSTLLKAAFESTSLPSNLIKKLKISWLVCCFFRTKQ